MEENKIQVYVKVDSNNVIISINSSVFLTDNTNWTQIDEGIGDIYAHASSNYLKKGIQNGEQYNYKLVDGNPVELTDDEKETLFPTATTTEPTLEERLASAESALSALMGV